MLAMCMCVCAHVFRNPSGGALIVACALIRTNTVKPLIYIIVRQKGGRLRIFCPAHWELGEIDGLLVHPGKASKLLINHRIAG